MTIAEYTDRSRTAYLYVGGPKHGDWVNASQFTRSSEYISYMTFQFMETLPQLRHAPLCHRSLSEEAFWLAFMSLVDLPKEIFQ